ncbi:hypothetical protein [Listeria booriae]|uniref:Uncharacterized protein n=1 Tax=Listeria booriae TaxID=1552123 RepID=A0A7X1BW69_9LIST|nr:hypothetical protein [Listeria booriae]MBC1333476.1 hypothetical protein [Listeria booriae]MBC2388781.1 hypothetical protein [Listeria booriae]
MRKKKLWIVLTIVVLVAGTGTGIIYSQQAKAQEESRIEAQKAKEAADMLEKQTAEKETKAKNAVAALYFDDKKVLLADGYTPAKATEAKQLAEALKNKELKESLVSEITKANVLYASIEGTQKATLALFKDADQKSLASGVDAAKLAAVKKAIDSVPQNIAKMNLNKAWTVASNLMKVEVAAKQEAEADRAAKENAVVTTSEKSNKVEAQGPTGSSSNTQGSGSSASASAGASSDNNSSSYSSSGSKSNSDTTSKNYASNEKQQSSGSGNSETSKQTQSEKNTSVESKPNPKPNGNAAPSTPKPSAGSKNENKKTNEHGETLSDTKENSNGGEDHYWGWD